MNTATRCATQHEELAPVCEEDAAPYQRIPPGRYELRCVGRKMERIRMYGNAWKCRLMFHFMDPEMPGTIAKFFHMGAASKPKAGRKSEYWKAWMIANAGELPKRGQTMTPLAFIDKIFLCEVGDVRKRFDSSDHAAEAVYSTVKQILELRGP